MANRTRTHEEPTIRRAQILREALRIVGELGYYGFTIQALAERCKLSNPGLLYYFGSKDKLLLALLDEIESKVEDRIAPLVALASRDSSSAEEAYVATAALMSAMVAHFREDATLTRFVAALQLESIHTDHPAHDWFRARENETIELFTRLAATWSRTPLSTARQLYALMHGIGQQWLRADQGFDIEEEWDRAFGLVVPRPSTA
jgi:AcrR family transcriptional regulator